MDIFEIFKSIFLPSTVKTMSSRLKHPIHIIGVVVILGIMLTSYGLGIKDVNYLYLFIFLLFIYISIFPILEKWLNQKVHSQSEVYSNNIVNNPDLQEKLDLQNNQIDVLKEVLTNVFDMLCNISSPLISKNELNEAFIQIKNNNIEKAKEIFNRLLQISITNNNYENKASNLRYLAVLTLVECNDLEEALPFYVGAKKLAPKHPENEKLDIIFEKYLKISYPVQDNGNIDLGRIKESFLKKYIRDMEKPEYSQLKLYIKFGLGSKIAREPQEDDSDRNEPRYVIEDEDENIIENISVLLSTTKTKKSRRYSLKELKASLDV